MQTKIKGTMTVLYGAHRKGVKGKREYNFIEVADGFEKKLFDTDIDPSETQHLQRGDEVTFEVEYSPFTERGKLLSLES